MKNVTIKLYTIDELDNRALERAYEEWLNYCDYSWDNENRQSLTEFTKLFPVKVKDWEYGYNRAYIDFVMTCEDEISELKGIRLWKYIYNNYYYFFIRPKKYTFNNKKYISKVFYEKIEYPLTGYYMDEVLLQPIYNFLKNPSKYKYMTFEDLMEKCLNNWVKECQRDYIECTSLEYFKEVARENGWLFLKNGEFFMLEEEVTA